MKNSRLLLLLLLVLTSLTLGCGSSSDESSPAIEFHYKPETRNRVIRFRAALKPDDVVNISLDKGHGDILWMADEGKRVASGDVLLKINMDYFEERLRLSKNNIDGSLDIFAREKSGNPAEIADLKMQLRNRELELDRAAFDRKWLFKPKTEDEIWKLKNSLKAAEINFDLARELFELQKNITSKGFDSKFSLRTSEIEKKSREIELDYARRMLKQLEQPPLREELAQIDFQRAVASGEIWLAENKLVSASISAKIREKNQEILLERHRSRFRDYQKTLDSAVQYAPREGIVVHPVLWGSFKFRVGQQAWQGVSIMQLIAGNSYYLEALLTESKIHGLKEKASATIRLDSLPEKEFAGEIRSIGRAPKPRRGAGNSLFKFIPVEIAMNANENLVYGDKADVTVDIGSFSGVFVPRDLVIKDEDKQFLILKTAFSSRKVEIELEDFDPDWLIWKNPPADQGVLLYP